MPRSLVTLERSDPGADVLVVTNMWPDERHPVYGIFVRRQVESLVAAGVSCDVLFVRGNRSPVAYFAAALRLAVLNARRRPYRLVHGHGGEVAPVVRCYVRAPVLVSFCGDDLLGTPRSDGTLTRQSRLRSAFLRRFARVLDATITKSRQMEAALAASARSRNTVLPNGVDRRRFEPLDRAEARRRLGWPQDERVALFAADPAVERKRHWLAEEACAVARLRLGDVRLHVAAGVSPDDMPMLMSAADCLLLTSAIEGSPNVVKEALMCELPVVSTDVGDVAEVLAGVEPSFVCPSDPQALGAALVGCLEHPQRSNGRQASDWLAQEAIADRLLELYDSLAPELTRRPVAQAREACAA